MITAIIVLAALIAAIIFSVFGVALYAFHRITGKRYNGNKNLKYFTAADFPELAAEPISFVSNRGQTLRGFLYRKETVESPKALVIFAHGFGAGHQAYTTEINALAEAGYWVLAYDATGCVASDGARLYGFDQGVLDLRSAIRYANEEPRFSKMKKILVGHSWGAFCVMNNVEAEGVCGAVAMCGFISGAKVLAQNTVGRKVPCLTFLAEAFLRLFNSIRFGKAANFNSLKSLQKTDKPVYLIFGSSDKTVSFRGNGAIFAKKFAESSNITCKICEGKAHNPYLTMDAERAMNQTFSEIAKQRKKNPVRALQMYKEIDYAKIMEEDSEVMRSIAEYCDRLADKKC